MGLPQWICVIVSAMFGTLAMRVVATAFRHGVVRHIRGFWNVSRRDEEPLKYYGELGSWLVMLVACYGFVGFQLYWSFIF